jgi:hypothetical protein
MGDRLKGSSRSAVAWGNHENDRGRRTRSRTVLRDNVMGNSNGIPAGASMVYKACNFASEEVGSFRGTMPSPVYHNDVVQRPGYLKLWEHTRHHQIHWFVECFAEAVRDFPAFYDGTRPHLNHMPSWVYFSTCMEVSKKLLERKNATNFAEQGVGATAAMIIGAIASEPALGCTQFACSLQRK